MSIMKGIDFNFNESSNLNEYQAEIQKWANNDYKIAVMQIGYGNTPNTLNNTIANYVKESGMELAYYWFVYGYNGIRNFTCNYFDQGVAFGQSVKALEIQGYKTPFKLAIDIESSGFVIKNSEQEIIQQMTPPSGENMYNAIKEFIDGFNTIITGKEFVLYSSLSFSQQNFDASVSQLCGSEWISTDQAGNPFDDASPIVVQERITRGYPNALKWCDNKWCGWQYSEDDDHKLVDLNGFNELFYANQQDIIPVEVFKNGDYVKLKSGCKEFAPNKIPESDKGKDYKIIATLSQNGEELYELNNINQYLIADELNMVSNHKVTINHENHIKNKKVENTLNPEWNELDEITQLALYIASFEGFTATPKVCGSGKWSYSIGYGTYAGNLTHVTPNQAIQLVKNYILDNKPSWDVAINQWSGAKDLSNYEKFGLYNFAYQMGLGHLGTLPAGLVAIMSNIEQYGKDPMQTFYWWSTGTDAQRRMSSESIAFMTGKLYFGESMAELPPEFNKAMANMPCISEMSEDYLPIVD